MSPGDLLLVGGAGLLAGAVNAVAGGGTLLTFPALLVAGLSPVAANITSSVGLISGYAGGSLAYRQELVGQRERARSLLLVSVLGGVAGAVLLLITPASAFRAAVPYLVLLSCALLALQPWLAGLVATHRPGADLDLPLRLGIGIAAVYGAYFGAGLGVLLLAVLGTLVADDLQRLNALKGVLSLVVNVVGVLVFVASGRVAWTAALVLAVTALLGGTLGVRAARRLPATALRLAVVVLGTLVGIALLVTG